MKIATKLALGLLVALGLRATVGTSHAQTLDCGQAACVAFSALPAEVEITTPVSFGIAYRFQAGSYSYVDPSSGATIGARIDLTLPPAFGVGQPTPAVPWTGTCFNVPDNGTVLPVWHRRCQWTRPAFTVAPGQTDVGSVSVDVRGQPYQAPVDGLIGFGASIAIADSGASDTDVGQLTLRGQGHIGFRAFDIHAGGYGFVIDDLGAVVKGRVLRMSFIVGDMLNPSNRPFTTSPSYASLSALVRSESDIYKYGGNQVDQLQGTLTLPEYAILKDISYRDSIWGSPYAEGNGWTTTRPLPGQLGGSITFDWKGGAPLGTPMSLRADGTYDAGQFGPWGVWQSEGHHVEVTFIMPCDSLLGMDLEDPLLDHGGVTFSGREKRIAVGGAVTYNNVSTTYDSTAALRRPAVPQAEPGRASGPDARARRVRLWRCPSAHEQVRRASPVARRCRAQSPQLVVGDSLPPARWLSVARPDIDRRCHPAVLAAQQPGRLLTLRLCLELDPSELHDLVLQAAARVCGAAAGHGLPALRVQCQL